MADAPRSKGELSPHKVAAIFDDAARARQAADSVRTALGLAPAHVRVVTPDTRRPGRAVEPESRGIFAVMLRAHAVLGVVGLLAGLLIFWTLWRMDLPLITQNPVAAGGAIVFFATMAGLMLGGLATLRPDHDVYVMSVLDACRDGRSAAIVHARTSEELDAARAHLQGLGGDLVSTL